MPSRILALDTSCGTISACVIAGGYDYIAQDDLGDSGKTRSTRIVPMLGALLEQAGLSWEQLDALALGAGPGSFTGLRIAAATLAGINAGLHLPIVHLSSLAITARQVKSDQPEPVRVLEDARAGEVFCGFYQNGHHLETDTCLRWDQIEKLKPGQYCCHSEPPIHLKRWDRLPLTRSRSQTLAFETQAACADVGDWCAIPVYPSPVYLQLSQAERQAHGA